MTTAYKIPQHLRLGLDPEVLAKAVLNLFTDQAVYLELRELNFKAFADAAEAEGDTEP